MAKKSDMQRTYSIAVIGLSGTEKDKGSTGVGKSCLCNRFTRPLADEYYTDHISVLSQSDFSGRVVNNDHFLYWGEVTKTSDEGVDFHFAVIEQTEFIDDSSFQPFKTGKIEPYVKRCSATKIQSAEKLMYICKNQLGIEKEYEQKVMPDGKMSVDGFVCVVDVSLMPNRPIERQVEYVFAILNSLMKTKKPIVLATSKHDEANDPFVKETEKLASRKEFKGSIPIVETSAHENVNVELAFIILAQMIDRTKGRSKIIPFVEAAKARREVLDVATEAYQSLIRCQVNDYRALWSIYNKKFAQNQDFLHYCELFGQDKAQKEFRRHIKKLKEDFIQKKKQAYLEELPDILQELLPDISSVESGDWTAVKQELKQHSQFGDYFVESPDDMPWQESDLVEGENTLIPFDLLDSIEAETYFKNHVNALQAEQKRMEMRQQFKQLLEETGYVTPGKSLSEVHVLLIGRECYEGLHEVDRQDIYDMHQKEIIDRARHNYQELLLEHADCFYRFTNVGPSGAITQEDINKITDILQEDSRYKCLDRLEQDRKLMLFRHLGFVHCPIREHCPAFPNCMDCLIERVIANKTHRPASWSRNTQWETNSDSNQLNLVILGSDGLANELVTEIRAQCEDDEYEMDNVLYSLDYRVIDGDVSLPQNSFRTSDFLPHGTQQAEPLRGCFCVYSSTKTIEYVRESLEKTLLSNLEQEDRLPFQGLPIVILFAADQNINEKDLICLREEGQTLADNLQCPFIDITGEELPTGQQFNEVQLRQALRSLVESIQHRAGSLNIYHSLPEAAEPDIRIIMCMFCGDPYSVEHVLGPLLNHQCCFTSGERSIILETFLGDSKRRVEVTVSSYHGANAFREELVHGFILVYSTKRKASLKTLSAFSTNIPNLPIQILAVTESGGANAFFSSDLSHALITEGNAVADRLQAHFMTATPTCQQKTAFYTPFFKEVWEKKPEIEQAFNMEETTLSNASTLQLRDGTVDRRTLPLHSVPPPPPHRRESYQIRPNSADGSADSESHYERLPTDGSQGDDLNEPLSPTFIEDHHLSPSDDSDLYSNIYTQENGEHLIKPSQIKSRRSLHGGWVDDSIFLREHRDDEWVETDHFQSYTMGRRGKVPPPIKPKPGGGKAKPGKLDLKNFTNVGNAIARLNLGAKEQGAPKLTKVGLHAPLATPESVELGSDYAQVKDAVRLFSSNNTEYAYAIVQDAIMTGNKMHRMRSSHRRDEKAKKLENTYPHQHEEDSSFEVSSPKDNPNSPNTYGAVMKTRGEGEKTATRRKDKKSKDDEKQVKRRQKEEEKQKRIAEKEKERIEKEKKKQKKVGTLKSGSSTQQNLQMLEDFSQSESNPIPLFLEKCIVCVEEEGLDSEGIYRVPGNRAHVELLFQKFDEDPNISIRELDIPVNAIATALKDFFSKRLPPLLPQEVTTDLIEVAKTTDKSCRLLALRALLKNLPKSNFEILKFVFQHFVKIAENCKLNSMDSKNLAICWWPTLLPIQFKDMNDFEQVRPLLEDSVQTMIDQFRFLFCGQEEVVMV